MLHVFNALNLIRTNQSKRHYTTQISLADWRLAGLKPKAKRIHLRRIYISEPHTVCISCVGFDRFLHASGILPVTDANTQVAAEDAEFERDAARPASRRAHECSAAHASGMFALCWPASPHSVAPRTIASAARRSSLRPAPGGGRLAVPRSTTRRGLRRAQRSIRKQPSA